MTMQINPQFAADLTQVEDSILGMATVSGEHQAVIERVSNRHTLPPHTGQTFKIAHVGKMEAMLGTYNTRWNQVQRYSARVYEIPVQYATTLTKMGDDMQQFLSAKFLAQIGAQAGNAVTRIVDKTGLALFQHAQHSNSDGGSSADPIKHKGLLRDIYEIMAAPDDVDSPIIAVMPTAHIHALQEEMLALNSSGLIDRPIPQGPTGSVFTENRRYNWMGTPIMEARNSERYGSAGYTAVIRRNTIDFVTARTMMKERVRDGMQGGGSWIMLIRKLFGIQVSPWAYENWFHTQHRAMEFGGA